MTKAEYLALPGINATAIKAGRMSMRLMRYAMTRADDTETPAMRFGSLIHAAVLDPDTIRGWAVCDADTWRAAGVKAWRTEHAGRVQVLQDEIATLMQLSGSVHANPDAHRLIASTEHEQPVQWIDDCYKQAKALLDGVRPGALVDLKTTRGPLDDHAITSHAWRLGYHVQLGWYTEGANRCGVKIADDQVYIIWLRQTEDFDCRVTRLSPSLVAQGREEAIEIARRYRVHEMCGVFPGVSDEVTTLEAPSWTEVGNEVDMGGLSDE